MAGCISPSSPSITAPSPPKPSTNGLSKKALRNQPRRSMRISVVVALLLLASTAARAQSRQEAGPSVESARLDTVVPGERYNAGFIHRFLLGEHYRDLWVTPIEVPILNLQT